jgi:glutaredoxin
MKIEIYLTRPCPHKEAVRRLVDDAVAQAGAAGAEIAVIEVNDAEEARARRVFGSPTIRVNGVDVEYGDREPDETTAGCRYYATPEGWKPVPPAGMVVRALNLARAREQGG